jgi:hypothetical protein
MQYLTYSHKILQREIYLYRQVSGREKWTRGQVTAIFYTAYFTSCHDSKDITESIKEDGFYVLCDDLFNIHKTLISAPPTQTIPIK